MKILELLHYESIKTDLGSISKEEVIEELINLLPGVKDNSELKSQLIQSVTERETICSTGVGNGVAIPHARVDLAGSLDLVLGISRTGIGFNAIDEKPARIFFLLIAGTESGTLHLKVLARISRMMNQESLRSSLLKCTSPAEVYKFFKNTEKMEIRDNKK